MTFITDFTASSWGLFQAIFWTSHEGLLVFVFVLSTFWPLFENQLDVYTLLSNVEVHMQNNRIYPIAEKRLIQPSLRWIFFIENNVLKSRSPIITFNWFNCVQNNIITTLLRLILIVMCIITPFCLLVLCF